MEETPELYEYAGFQYRVEHEPGSRPKMIPVAGQHHAASKLKHLFAAAECYLEDKQKKGSPK